MSGPVQREPGHALKAPQDKSGELRWVDLPLRVRGLIVISFPLAALLFGIASGYLAGIREREARLWVDEARQDQLALGRLAGGLKDAESAMRGFLLLSDQRMYEAFESARRGTSTLTERLRGELNDTPAESALMRDVSSLVAQRLDLLAQEANGSAGHVIPIPLEEAVPKLRSGEEISAALKEKLDQLNQTEDALLHSRLAKLEQAQWWDSVSRLVAAVGGAGGAILALLLFGGNIVGRIDLLQQNALRLAREEPLLRTERSLDELGQLEHNLEQASGLLSDRSRALHEARLQAERANVAKSEFLSRMSHELRTPLNAILGFGQILEIDSPTQGQCESIHHILKGGRQLLGLINEILDIARIEAGQMSVSVEQVDPHEVLNESVELLRPLARERSITIEYRPQVDGLWVMADRSRLRQVVLNLVSNAIKYNREGGTIRIVCQRTLAGFGRIQVEDTGYGIAPSDLVRLFTPFERLNAPEFVEGTGLGLALAKRLMQLMGGDIGAESTVGKGSVFWLQLPLCEAAEGSHAEGGSVIVEPRDLVTRRTVLYFEDNLANFKLVKTIFARRPNFKLISAMQGGLGLDLARQCNPDLILLDLNLPDIPGREVFQRLRGDERTSAIPVIIISAHATRGEIDRMQAAGVDGYITKPLAIVEFLATVDGLIEGRKADRGF